MKTPKGDIELAAYEACENWAKFDGGVISVCFHLFGIVIVLDSSGNVIGSNIDNVNDVLALAQVLSWLSQADHERIASSKTMEELTSALSVAGWRLKCIYRGHKENGYQLSPWSLGDACNRLDKKMKGCVR